MILIQWLKFLFLIYNFIFVNKSHFPHIFLKFTITYFLYNDLHSYSIIFKNILSSSSFLFFLSSYSFTFHLFSSFYICLFFFPCFPFFFLFANWHNFLNLVCHFLRALLPCSRTFCCPAYLLIKWLLTFPTYFNPEKLVSCVNLATTVQHLSLSSLKLNRCSHPKLELERSFSNPFGQAKVKV